MMPKRITKSGQKLNCSPRCSLQLPASAVPGKIELVTFFHKLYTLRVAYENHFSMAVDAASKSTAEYMTIF